MEQLTADVDVAVVGAGPKGTGIAEVAARAHHNVRILDGRPGVAVRGVERIRQQLARDVSSDHLNAAEARFVAGRLHPVTAVADLTGCGVVIEAVDEGGETDPDLLRAIEAAVEQGVGHEVLMATSASSASVTRTAAGLGRPELLVGLRFFDPVPQVAVVEVVRGEATEPKVVDAAVDLVRSWGKTPVLCRSSPGFVVNRISRPFFGEALRVAESRAADPATIDAVLRETGGFRKGAFELADLLGQDVDLEVSRGVWEQTFHDPRYAPTVFQQRLVDTGRLGRRTSRGIFAYTPEGEALDADPLTAPRRPAPPVVQLVDDDFGPMAPFLDRIEAGGVGIERLDLSEDQLGEELPGLKLPGGGLLRVTDGSTARSWTLEAPGGVVLLDWAHDPAGCRRVVLMAPRDVDPTVLDGAIGVCQASGAAVSVIGDSAGGIVARTVAMLVNEAVELVARGDATATDVDVAMLLGASYPSGPLEWGDRVGAVRVASVLGELHDETPTGRYRISPRLDEAVMAEENLRDL
ncbi:MAG: 3-hydroxybutyryl-CoA dehydrogenase [Actinomycetota bacterium]|nr:3-hydroxybutyryl-CoA dehydrogenase [Actinomycetota bacterium]